MQVTVKAFGMVRNLLGQQEFTLDLPEDATVRAAIARLIELSGVSPDALLSADGNKLKVRAIVNGAAAVLDSPLQDGAELNLMLAIGGGA
jgi:molybdopterin converting factor small subunit